MSTPFKVETKTTLVNIIGDEAYFSDYSGIKIVKLEDYVRGPIAEHKFQYIKLFCGDETPAEYARRERKLARFILFCLCCIGLPRDIARAICIAAF